MAAELHEKWSLACGKFRLSRAIWSAESAPAAENDGGYSSLSAYDSARIRAAAVAAGVPVTTTLAGFAEAVKGIEAVRGEGTGLTPLSLQEWQTIGSGRVERWKSGKEE